MGISLKKIARGAAKIAKKVVKPSNLLAGAAGIVGGPGAALAVRKGAALLQKGKELRSMVPRGAMPVSKPKGAGPTLSAGETVTLTRTQLQELVQRAVAHGRAGG